MNDDNLKKRKLISIKELTMLGLMVALLEAVKWALMCIPNVELVSFIIVMFTLILGWKALFGAIAFAGLEILIWGFGVWSIIYLYIWPLLVVLTLVVCKFCRDKWKMWPYVFLVTVYGLLFGLLGSIPYFFIGGPYQMITWWVAGIPYDLIHGISNGVLMAVLFNPCKSVLKKVAII